MNARLRRRITILTAVLSGVLLVAGCSSHPGSPASSTDSAGEDAPKAGAAFGQADGTDSLSARAPANGSAVSADQPVLDRQVISTGAITLQSDDIAKARQDAIDIVTQAGGHIDNEDSQSGPDGTMTHSSLVFRVPAHNFDAVMDHLAGVANAVQQTRQAEDVTTRVIDVAARIRVQEGSIRRLEALYSHAETIGQIISLESQLSRRQADLDSLKQRQAWLRDQTSLSTITVSIGEPDELSAETKPAKVHHGFLKGLYAGWDAFVAVTMGILATIGAVLPFLVALIVLVLAYRLFRRVRA